MLSSLVCFFSDHLWYAYFLSNFFYLRHCILSPIHLIDNPEVATVDNSVYSVTNPLTVVNVPIHSVTYYIHYLCGLLLPWNIIQYCQLFSSYVSKVINSLCFFVLSRWRLLMPYLVKFHLLFSCPWHFQYFLITILLLFVFVMDYDV